MLKAEHKHQNDAIVINMFEMQLVELVTQLAIPAPRQELVLQLHYWLWLSFLHRTGFHCDQFDLGSLEKHIYEMQEEHVRYEQRVGLKRD